MNILRQLRKQIRKRFGREFAIRYRLLRAGLSPAAMLAERRADYLMVSYPKCGRTWLRMMLSRALASHFELPGVDYLATDMIAESDSEVPRIRISHDDAPHWKTPHRLERSKRRYRQKNVLLLVRDPRDVVVSMYFERTRREQAYDKSLHEFLYEPKGSIDTIISYYNIWAERRHVPRAFGLVRYEDLQSHTVDQLRRIFDFLNITDYREEHLGEAVQFASFSNMRKMELNNEMESGRLRARNVDDVESYKTRRGVVGGYLDYLSQSEIEWLDDKLRQELDPYFGYHATRPDSASERALAT